MNKVENTVFFVFVWVYHTELSAVLLDYIFFFFCHIQCSMKLIDKQSKRNTFSVYTVQWFVTIHSNSIEMYNRERKKEKRKTKNENQRKHATIEYTKNEWQPACAHEALSVYKRSSKWKTA